MNDHIPSLIQQHEQFLRQQLQQLDMAAPELKKAMRYSLLAGGKRFRPLLIYLCGEIFALPMPLRDVLAASVEMMHCYSLIHDDLPAMDNDDFRRALPTCHRAFDEATAILAGDALANWSVDILLEQLPRFVSPRALLAMARCLLRASGVHGMVSGQSLDLSILNLATVPEASLAMIHQLKTGQLIAACIDLVLIAAEAMETKQGKRLQDYATDLGIAFQMQDDFLDRYASPQVLGKCTSSDTVNAKFTYADYYDKDALHRQLQLRFSAAVSALDVFGAKADPIFAITQQLALRSQITLNREN